MTNGFFACGRSICRCPLDDGANILVRDPVIRAEVMKGFHGGKRHGAGRR